MEKFNDYSAIRFVFGNTEFLDISREDFKAINFSNIVENFSSDYNDNGIFYKYKVANDIFLVLKKESNKKYCPYDFKECETTIFKRLEYGDIKTICLMNNKDEIIEEFYVNYDGNEININQIARINKNDNFEISVFSGGI